jgi:CheY-like chemotaxis protein
LKRRLTAARQHEPGSARDPISGVCERYTLPTVLVVDDMEDNRDLYAMSLSRLGYVVETAVDGDDGVARAVASGPAVILMDLAMPNVDGFEATQRIRATASLAGVYIIAISAFTDAVSIQRALAAGCDEVLAKPCPPEQLAERVAIGVAGARQRERERDAG